MLAHVRDDPLCWTTQNLAILTFHPTTESQTNESQVKIIHCGVSVEPTVVGLGDYLHSTPQNHLYLLREFVMLGLWAVLLREEQEVEDPRHQDSLQRYVILWRLQGRK